jgi:dynamin 1-like protein
MYIGERTIAVLTKLDLMDKGTNACMTLTQKAGITVHLGIIGVVNRSQDDINKNKSIKNSIDDERKFLEKYYPRIARENGTEYLATTLSMVFYIFLESCFFIKCHQLHYFSY